MKGSVIKKLKTVGNPIRHIFMLLHNNLHSEYSWLRDLNRKLFHRLCTCSLQVWLQIHLARANQWTLDGVHDFSLSNSSTSSPACPARRAQDGSDPHGVLGAAASLLASDTRSVLCFPRHLEVIVWLLCSRCLQRVGASPQLAYKVWGNLSVFSHSSASLLMFLLPSLSGSVPPSFIGSDPLHTGRCVCVCVCVWDTGNKRETNGTVGWEEITKHRVE